jgi:hypothetical protein
VGQIALTAQPCRCNAVAIRADSGHHLVAAIKTEYWDLPGESVDD